MFPLVSQLQQFFYKRDQDKSDAFLSEILSFFTLPQLVCLDETSKERGDLRTNVGWVLRGQVGVNRDYHFGRGDRVSALVVLTSAGVLDWAITPGMFTKEKFLQVTTEDHVDWSGRTRGPILVSCTSH